MKVSLFVHDLASNPIVRAAPIGKALQKMGYEVEVIGLTVNSEKIFDPYKNSFSYKTIKSYSDIRWFVIHAFKLAKMAEGDIIYAFKPLWSSFFPALLASGFGLRKRLLLDVEDNELWEPDFGFFKELLKRPFYPKNRFYLYLLHPFTFIARKKTVVCQSLKKRYGGNILLHGPDEDIHNPEIMPPKHILLRKYNLPENKKFVGFAGRPVFYNGLDKIIEGMKSESLKNWDLVLVGNPEFELFQAAKKILKDRCHLIGALPHEQMPEILHIIDVIPILQEKNPATNMQIPAKLLEAMAMKKIVIATDVCDIPEILKNRGYVVSTVNTAKNFIETLKHIEVDDNEALKKSDGARNFYITNASSKSIISLLKNSLKFKLN